jgi:hypothetical protein
MNYASWQLIEVERVHRHPMFLKEQWTLNIIIIITFIVKVNAKVSGSVKSSAFFFRISFTDAREKKRYRSCLLNFPPNKHVSSTNSCKFSLNSFGYSVCT